MLPKTLDLLTGFSLIDNNEDVSFRFCYFLGCYTVPRRIIKIFLCYASSLCSFATYYEETFEIYLKVDKMADLLLLKLAMSSLFFFCSSFR